MKAFGGVLNGLDGNFGPAFERPKDERQDQPVLAFSIGGFRLGYCKRDTTDVAFVKAQLRFS